MHSSAASPFPAIRGLLMLPSLLALIFMAVLGTARPAQARLTLTQQGKDLGFSLSLFAGAIPNDGSVGPLGIAFPSTGGVLVADKAGDVLRFPTDADGQSGASVPVAQNYGDSNAVGLTQVGGSVYMTRQSQGDMVQLNSDGTFNQVIVPLSFATGIVGNPANGHLLVTNQNNRVVDVDPIAKTKKPLVLGVTIDGISLSPDGKTLYAAVYGGTSVGHIFGFDSSTGTQVYDSGFIDGSPDGIAVGSGNLAGNIFVNTNGGTVVEVSLNPAAPIQTVIASGGSRGDFLTADPRNGTLLITQTDRILRLTPAAGGGFGADNTTHVLWTNTDGTASVWNYNAVTGTYTSQSFGPYAGWTAKAIAEGPNGSVRLLWDNVSGQMSLWNLSDARPSDTCLLYGPYAGWTAVGLTVGPDNAAHLLWDNANGRVSLWNMSDANPPSAAVLYGPYSGWTGKAIAIGPDGHERLLWNNTNGQMSLWNLADPAPANSCLVYGPYAGWTATALAVGPDNAAHLLWDNANGRVSLWNMSDANAAGSAVLYGPYSGWSGTAIALGSNGQERLLWDNTGGPMSLWNLSDPKPDATCLVAGPFAGWTAIGIAAGP